MFPQDKTGRKLKIGQMMDVMLIGMFQGKLVAIKETPIALAKDQIIRPHVAIAITVTPFILPNGLTPDVYIIGEPDPNDPLVKGEEERGKPRLVVS